MMTDVFLPPIGPSINSSRKITMLTLETNFGDGYGQRAGDGINTRGETWQAEWRALTQEQADEIEAFFEAPERAQAFLSPLCQKGAKNTLQITNATFLSGKMALPADKALAI